MAVLATLMGLAVGVTMDSVASARADNSTGALMNVLEVARNQATSQRRDFQLVFTLPNKIEVFRVEIPSNSTTLVQTAYLEMGQTYKRWTTMGDPDGFGHSGEIAFGSTPTIRFTSDGSLINSSGDVLNGTLFVAIGRQAGIGPRRHDFRRDGPDSIVDVERHSMGELMTQSRFRTRAASSEGFSLMEVIISTAILGTGLLALAGYMAYGLAYVSGSSFAVLAREKAREAVESVHTARDTGRLTWAKIQNDNKTGGVFKHGLLPISQPPAPTAWSTRPTTGRSKSFAPRGRTGFSGTATTTVRR